VRRTPRVPEGLGETGLAPGPGAPGGFPAWQPPVARLLSAPVIAFLRFIGVTNAAIWFGGAFFFTFVGAPTFFTDEMRRLFPPPYNGAVAQMALDRFFIFNYGCAIVAGLHLAAEWLYAGREIRRATVALLAAMFLIALSGGVWLEPKLEALHKTRYAEQYRLSPMPSADAQKAADKSFRRWHGAAQAMNLAMLAGLLLFLAHIIRPDSASKSLRSPQIRG